MPVSQPEPPGHGRPRGLWAALLCLSTLVGVLLTAAPAFAHAELLGTSPRDGQRLTSPPRMVVLQFSEPVGLVPDGITVVHAHSGRAIHAVPAVQAGPAVTAGPEVQVPITGPMGRGDYQVRWRVVSSDGHPVAGVFSFGVGAAGRPAPPATSVSTWSWPVTVTRWVGYVAFAVVVGVLALLLWCWPPGWRDASVQRLLRLGLATAVVITAVGLLLQGPEDAGVSAVHLFDPRLLLQVVQTPFGVWMQVRLFFYIVTGACLLAPEALGSQAMSRTVAAAATVVVAVTYSGTGHAATSGSLAQVVDSLHVLCAGVWVGGLLALTVASASRSDRPGPEVFARFSGLAMTSVLLLVGTGVASSLFRFSTLSQLWDSSYGRLLLVKLVLVAAALAGAATSRRLLREGETPWRSVRYEAVAASAVLAVTAVLTLTAPPSR